MILIDHVSSTSKPIYWIQKAIEPIAVRIDGDHLTRRPADIAKQLGFDIVERHRLRRGIVERLVARKPAESPDSATTPPSPTSDRST